MEGVAKLMEHRGHVVPRDEVGLTLGSLRVVAAVVDHRLRAVEGALGDKLVHPGAGGLGIAVEVVAVEETEVATVLILYRKYMDIVGIDREVKALLEGETISALSGVEDAIAQHGVDLEVREHVSVAEVEAILLHLSGIVYDIPGLEGKVAALSLAGKVLDRCHLCLSLGDKGLLELSEEVIGSLLGAGHLIIE